MKKILLLALLVSFSSCASDEKKPKKDLVSEEDKAKFSETANDVSSATKKALRRIGRKSMDETCTLNKSKEACAKEKAEHEALNAKEDVEGVPAN